MRLRPLARVVCLVVLATAPRPAAAWLTILAGAPGGNDVPEAAAVLPGGDVVVTGSVQNGGTHEDLLAARLDAFTGRTLWRLELNGESGGDDPDFALDAGWDVAVDRGGDVIIGGTLETPDGGPDAAVLRLDGRTGREQWRASMRVAQGAHFDLVHDVLAHPSGDVIAVVLATDDAGTHFFAVRLDGESGTVRWRRPLPFPTHQQDLAALDSQGSLVAAGLDYDADADQAVTAVVRVGGDDGALVWSRQLRGFVPAALAVGPDDAVVIGGRRKAAGAYEGTLLRLEGTGGDETLQVVMDGRDATVDRIAVAADGTITVAGTRTDDRERVVFMARHEALSGAPLWRTVLEHGRSASLAAGVSALALTRRGDAVAALLPPVAGDVRRVVRVDGKTGAERWRYESAENLAGSVLTTRRGDVVGTGLTPWSESTGLDATVFALDGRTGRHLGGPGRGERPSRPISRFQPAAFRAPMCSI